MQVEYYNLNDDGIFPNNELPVIVYRAAWKFNYLFPAAAIARQFKKNNWGNTWQSNVYGYHHYHSTAHEILGVYKGKTKLRLGGEYGITIELKKGDAILIPAGVAHKNLSPEKEFKCVGAYPAGQDYDMNYGKPNERPRTDKNIEKVSLPEFDPIQGVNGPLVETWRKQTEAVNQAEMQEKEEVFVNFFHYQPRLSVS